MGEQTSFPKRMILEQLMDQKSIDSCASSEDDQTVSEGESLSKTLPQHMFKQENETSKPDGREILDLKDNISMLEELLKKKQQELAASSEQANANVVDGEKLFAASVAANEDHWVEYLINSNLPLQKQLDRLNLWLDVHKPSHIYRSSRVGWIAVKFRDKKKKVPEAKKAWENLKDQFRHNSTINRLAREFGVVGGKWMCHMPVRLIDDVWSKLAIALVNGKLGSSVFMVKVSPVEDMDETVSNGDHVIVVYNTNYKDVDQ